MARGLILFAHGARDPLWAEPFEALVDRVRTLTPATPVRLAFLELMQPDLDGAVADLVAGGIDTIRIAPIFFGQGGHLRRDLPARVEALRTKYRGASFACGPAAGEDGDVLDALARFCVRWLDEK